MGGIMSSASGAVAPDIENGLQPEVKKASELYRIARTGNVDAFEKTYKESDLTVLSPAKNTLLHVAAQHGNNDVVKFIAKKYPALLFVKNQIGDTALHLAAKSGHESTVKALVDIFHKENVNGETALHEALSFSKKSDELLKKTSLIREAFQRKAALDAMFLISQDFTQWIDGEGNDPFHYAAYLCYARYLLHQHGNDDIVKFIADKYPALLLFKNQRGDTALHLAARFGHESMVKALVHNHEGNKHDLLLAENENGNTALHEVLSFSKKSVVAKYLIEQDPELSYSHNKKQESIIYLAAKAGLVDCVSKIIKNSKDQQHLDQSKKTSLIQEAFLRKDVCVLEAMFLISSDYTQWIDDKGKNPLHHAAYLGDDKKVRYLLGKCASFAIQGDNKGSLPIHLASIKDHLNVVEMLLEDQEELLDKYCCSILHVAAKNGSSKVVNYVLKNLEHLINMKDKNGNTALHLAAKNWQAMIVSTLTWDKRVDINAQNNKGETVLDVAEATVQLDHPNNQWLTINALRTAGAVRLQSIAAIEEEEEEETATNNKEKVAAIEKEEIAANKSIYKEKVNFRLIVAILIATVAFEAGFRLPYEQNSSMENMLGRKAFTIYVFSNTIAMYSSISAAVVLGWAQSGDLTLVINALNFTLPLFWLALSMMSTAFTTGVYIVINDHKWLRIASLVMGGAFHWFLLCNSIVLFSPIVSSNQYLRYLSYYPFRFLVLMNSGWLTNTSRFRYFMWSTQH